MKDLKALEKEYKELRIKYNEELDSLNDTIIQAKLDIYNPYQYIGKFIENGHCGHYIKVTGIDFNEYGIYICGFIFLIRACK